MSGTLEFLQTIYIELSMKQWIKQCVLKGVWK